MKISVCNHNTNKYYKNQEWAFDNIAKRNANPIRTSETAQEYAKMKKAQKGELKDHGGFVGGWLSNGSRKNGNVICRTLGALDADNIKDAEENEEFLLKVRVALLGMRYFIYSTHSHLPDKPRYRIVILLNREVSEDEYPPLMRMVARQIGMDYFDDSTYQANRMMYWASCPSNGEFFFEENGGEDSAGCEPLNVDSYLSMYADWRDVTQWPTSSRQSQVMKRQLIHQQDPTEKAGIVGAFCRTYSVTDAIDVFLSDIYAPSVINGRYDYLPGEGTAGVVVYQDKWVYSHHATDPACEKLLNAFDLVRIHKFSYGADGGELDDKESFKLMSEFAIADDNVQELLLEERQRDRVTAEDDFSILDSDDVQSESADPEAGDNTTGAEESAADTTNAGVTSGSTNANTTNGSTNSSTHKKRNPSWTKLLEREPKTTVIKNTLNNLLLILSNDEELQEIRFNQLANQIYAGKLPWPHPMASWRDADTAQLVAFVEGKYGTFSARNYDIALTKVADDRSYHPIKEYLDGLPAWDKTPRVERLLVEYFGAEDNVYTRDATRKLLAAAVARIYHPGIKFDSMLVLNGRTDLGKSTFFARLAGDWFSDSLSFIDMGKGKDAAEKIQGVWMIEIPEMAGLSKIDVNNIKGFLSRQDDQFRPSYGRTVESHPRQCVFVGSTNAESAGFLRDDTGNRRFWVIPVHGCDKRGWDLPKEIVPQIWAEAKYYWEHGEELFLSGDAKQQANVEQVLALESDSREGLVTDYLEMLIPANWYDMEIYDRRNYVLAGDDERQPEGTVHRDFVSNIEIWTECFGHDRAKMDKAIDSQKIKLIMQKIGGWTYANKKRRIKGYGPQYVWVRDGSTKDDSSEG